jgi:hypothetical protein
MALPSSPNHLSCAAPPRSLPMPTPLPSSAPILDPPRRALPSRSQHHFYLDRYLRRHMIPGSIPPSCQSVVGASLSVCGRTFDSRQGMASSLAAAGRGGSYVLYQRGSGSSPPRWPLLYQSLNMPSRCALCLLKYHANCC